MSASKSVTERLSAAMPRLVGTGTLTLLIAVYAILVMAATGRAVVQIIERFWDAPIAYTVSAASAVVYIVAMIALIVHKGVWYRIAWVTVSIEFAGVVVIGAITQFFPNLLGPESGDAFGRTSTVWTQFGLGYWFVPLVLPIAGMWWLRKHPAGIRGRAAAVSAAKAEKTQNAGKAGA